jgi:hypothetical protein
LELIEEGGTLKPEIIREIKEESFRLLQILSKTRKTLKK